MLKVSGDSMIEAGIMPNDFVIVDKSQKPKNKDIVIAQVDGQWTMKYLIKEKEKYTLMPANPKYKPIHPKSELYIAGVVVSVVRKYR
jgi:SOS-response transcriptional repressor LexA